MRIYLDNAATTPLDPRVLDYMLPLMKDNFGNPSSIHHHGRQCKAIIEESRKKIANSLRSSIGEIFFTSSATEANNLIIQAAVRDLGVTKIISTPIEHHCVLHTIEHIVAQQRGVESAFLSVDESGQINMEELDQLLASSEVKCLVCIMHVNNEIGTISNVKSISEICEKHNALFQCDAVQALGKYDIDLSQTKISFLSGSAHKFYGPKGVGFVYINSDNQIKPLIHGGAQERNMRAGTENTYGIAGIGKALELCLEDMQKNRQHITFIRSHLIEKLKSQFDGVKIISPETDGHYCILNVAFPKSDKTDMIMFNLDILGISASAGSACSSGVEQASHVLRAIGLSAGYQAIRFSFSHHNTKEEIDFLVEKLKGIL